VAQLRYHGQSDGQERTVRRLQTLTSLLSLNSKLDLQASKNSKKFVLIEEIMGNPFYREEKLW
jgi:hypothetical protein